MPASPLAFRVACGHFAQVFTVFMTSRAEGKAAMRTATLKVNTLADGVSAGLLLSLLCFGNLLYLCGDVELNPGPPKTRQTKLTGGGRRGTDTTDNAQPDTPTSTPTTEPTLQDLRDMVISISNKWDAKLPEVKTPKKTAPPTAAATPEDHPPPEEATSTDHASLLHDVNSKFNAIQTSLSQLTNVCAGIQQDILTLNNAIVDLKSENEEIKKENSELKSKLTSLEQRTDGIERQMKRNNLIFYGIDRDNNEPKGQCEQAVRNIVRDKLNISEDVKFESVYRVTNQPNSPVIARFSLLHQRNQVLKAKKLLKETQIFVSEDFPSRIRDTRKKLVPFLKEARKAGRKAVIVYDHLIVDGVKMFLDGEGLVTSRK